MRARAAGAILTGGASRRMGRDKALVDVAGRPMAALVADALLAGGCSPVRLVGGSSELRVLGFDVVDDLYPGDGPVGGVVTALRSYAGTLSGVDGVDGVDAVLITACDLPALDADTVRRLLDDERDADVAVAFGGRREPACAVWRTAALPAVAALFADGVRALHDVLDVLVTVDVAVDPESMLNVNRVADIPEEAQ